jgi:uncharacterized protein YcbK (DUF882 family)
MKLTENFTYEEMACRHCEKMEIPLTDVERLQQLRTALGFSLVISSGYRCPAHNEKVSTTGLNGPHTKGAFDVLVYGSRALEVLEFALRFGFKGIGVSQKGPQEARFIHLDRLPFAEGQPRPFIWSY